MSRCRKDFLQDKQKEIATCIRTRRLSLNMSLRDVAELVGKSTSFLADIESVRTLPAFDTLCYIAFFLKFNDSEKANLLSLSPGMLEKATAKIEAKKRLMGKIENEKEKIRNAKKEIENARKEIKKV